MNEKELCERLRQNPELKERVEQLLSIIENEDGEATLANDAEQRVIDELRQMGKDALQSWADRQSNKASDKLKKQKPGVQKHGKKNSDGTAVTEK